MRINAETYPPMLPTRPCRFCLSLQHDSVFADFDVDGDRTANDPSDTFISQGLDIVRKRKVGVVLYQKAPVFQEFFYDLLVDIVIFND